MSDLITLAEKFNVPNTSIIYRCSRNKTDLEVLLDANQSAHTFGYSDGYYIVVSEEFTHPDYTRVE